MSISKINSLHTEYIQLKNDPYISVDIIFCIIYSQNVLLDWS